MKNFLTSTGYIVHEGYDCPCLCHTKRCLEIKHPCPCEIKAKQQLGIPIDAELPINQ
jgi:hypothetical protein